jgi:hypothetical protein
MRNAWFDRSKAGSRHGMRGAAVAAWAIVFALFAILAVPSLSGTAAERPVAPIASLVAHAVQPAADSCHCEDDDQMMTAPAPALC